MIIKYKFENMNTYINKCRRNPFLANGIKQKETEIARQEFLKEPKVTNYPIELSFKWHIKNKLSDLDGKIPKSIIDGMVRAEIIADDNVKYIQKITHEYVEDKEEYVEVEIKELKKGGENMACGSKKKTSKKNSDKEKKKK